VILFLAWFVVSRVRAMRIEHRTGHGTAPAGKGTAAAGQGTAAEPGADPAEENDPRLG